jgi:hypothetical protein
MLIPNGNTSILINDLCDTFQKLSKRTWKRMKNNVTTDILLNEEAFTALNLQDLFKLHSAQVTVVDFSKKDESTTTGADWEWWFLGKQCFGMAVQAKRLDYGRYNIDYIPKNNYPQIDRLLDYVIDRKNENNDIAPMYCFYNWWPGKDVPSSWNCGSFKMDSSLLGCTIADGWSIYQQHLSGIYDAHAIARISQPWHCIVCCGVISNDLAERAKGIAERLQHLADYDSIKIFYKEMSIPNYKLHDKLPDYVLKAYKFANEGNLEKAAEAMGKGPKKLVFFGDVENHLKL